LLFTQTIRDIFIKINQTNETVNRIDKDTGVVANSQKILVEDFKELKHKCEDHFTSPTYCSSQNDVKFLLREKTLQNGRIDTLTKTTSDLVVAINKSKDRKQWKKEWKADLIKTLILFAALFGSLISYMQWAESRKHADPPAAQPLNENIGKH
jgi:hypothetical protein